VERSVEEKEREREWERKNSSSAYCIHSVENSVLTPCIFSHFIRGKIYDKSDEVSLFLLVLICPFSSWVKFFYIERRMTLRNIENKNFIKHMFTATRGIGNTTHKPHAVRYSIVTRQENRHSIIICTKKKKWRCTAPGFPSAQQNIKRDLFQTFSFTIKVLVFMPSSYKMHKLED